MIYFIQAETVNHIKIGYVNGDDASDRLAELQVGSPVPLRLIGTMPGTMEDEKNLHRRFASSRLSGEWFRSTPELLQLVAPMEFRRLGETEIVEKSVRIKVLTVGRKQFTRAMLDQLPFRKFVDAKNPIADIENEPREYEDGEFWGWVKGKVSGNRWLIFELDGTLFKWLIELEGGPLVGMTRDFWESCCKRWFRYDNQLFIGT